jgi:hypothetical protein
VVVLEREVKRHKAQANHPAAPECTKLGPGDIVVEVMAEVTCVACIHLTCLRADARKRYGRPQWWARKKFR